MAENTNTRIALSLLDEVEKKADDQLGNAIAINYGPDAFDARVTNFCEDMVKQCELAEKKAPDSKEVQIRSNLLKARLHGCSKQAGPMDRSYNHAVAAYEKALELGANEVETRYRMAIFYQVKIPRSGAKEKSIENFERVIALAGADSELGIESAKELEKAKAKKNCFVATAVYGSETAHEVIVLREFRDAKLLRSYLGRAFVRVYYATSPPIAAFLQSVSPARTAVRKLLLDPIVRFIERWLSRY
jgi:hypothetical protein